MLHPGGLACPRCGGDRPGVHRRHRAPVLDYRCRGCRRVFSASTGTALQKTACRPSAPAPIPRGSARGVPAARLARELARDRMKLLGPRHWLRLRAHAAAGLDPDPLPDATVEADGCHVNAGERRHPQPRPG